MLVNQAGNDCRDAAQYSAKHANYGRLLLAMTNTGAAREVIQADSGARPGGNQVLCRGMMNVAMLLNVQPSTQTIFW